MKNGFLIFFLLIFTAGCGKKDKIPGDVLPQKKMQAVLWDMMRVDQFLADYVLNKDSSKNKTTESLLYYKQVFAIHKISKEEFQHSFAYYKTHPVLLKTIMDSISAAPKDTIAIPVVAKQVTDSVVARTDSPRLSPPDIKARDSSKIRSFKKPSRVN